jgi:hypothetical protein
MPFTFLITTSARISCAIFFIAVPNSRVLSGFLERCPPRAAFGTAVAARDAQAGVPAKRSRSEIRTGIRRFFENLLRAVFEFAKSRRSG